MHFLYQPLTWGFLLVLLPLLIHLINLMRQKRVDWAAMEFLRMAYRKHRKWVWLKQMLLLLARMLAIAIAVAMLAHLITQEQWAALFGGKTTHHIVLLDDSYSMGDQSGTARSFDRAGQVLQSLAEQAMAQTSVQKFTLLRFSQADQTSSETSGQERSLAGAPSPTNAPASPAPDTSADEENLAEQEVAARFGELADLNAVTVDDAFDVLLEDRRRRFSISQRASGPVPALNLTAQLARIARQDKPIVYVLSDFREKDWKTPSAARAAIERIEDAGATVNLVQCTDKTLTNLGIVDITPAEGTRAAGVPLFVDVTVKNHGPRDAAQVAIALQSVEYGNDANQQTPAQRQGKTNDLPGVVVEKLAVGESVTRRVQVFFTSPGQHVVQATLAPDALAADNRQWCVVQFPDAVPVLVIDGDPQQRNAGYLDSVFQPGQRVRTGVRPFVKTAAFLRDIQPEELATYQTIYLLDVPQLDPLAQSNLQQYVKQGGGLAVFFGPQCQLKFYNQWHQSHPDFFPIPVESAEILPTSDSGAPDVIPTDHPIFRILMDEGQIFAGGILVPQFVRPARRWKSPEDASTQIVAKLRDGSPLAVDHAYGNGRVFVMLTTLAPLWNNWATQPTFPVMILETQAYLDSGHALHPQRFVGARYHFQLDKTRYLPTLEFLLPGKTDAKPRVISVNAAGTASNTGNAPDAGNGGNAPDAEPSNPQSTGPSVSDNGPLYDITLAADRANQPLTDRAGVYEAWPRTVDGKFDVRRFSINVNPLEGDLNRVDTRDLAESLATTGVELITSDDVTATSQDTGGFSWSHVLAGLLLLLLIGEQLLSYSASYHPGKSSLRVGTRPMASAAAALARDPLSEDPR